MDGLITIVMGEDFFLEIEGFITSLEEEIFGLEVRLGWGQAGFL